MMKLKLKHRPSAQVRALQYRLATRNAQPPTNKTYENNTPSPVKAVAEFEPMGGLVIAYPGTVSQNHDHIQLPPGGPRAFGIPNELIVRAQQNDSKQPVHIFILCADLDERANIIKDLQKTADELKIQFKPDNVHLVPWDTDTYWTRDYAPWWIYNEKTANYGIVKHGYTTLGGGSVGLVEGAEGVDPRQGLGIFRPNDDFGAVKLSDYIYGPIRKWNNAEWPIKQKLPPIKEHDWYYLGLLDVGGNYMVTGTGAIASSYLVATQNEIPFGTTANNTDPSPADIEARMKYILDQFNRFMGVHKYHVLTDPTGTYIGHIDCWGKYLAADKILIAQSQDPAVNKQLDTIAEYFSSLKYTVYRVMCQNVYIPDSDDEPATTAAYTNSLILNNCVYVPLAGQEYGTFDQNALAVYQKALSGYQITGIKSKPGFPWLGTDAMHCRTNAIPRTVVDNWLKSQKLL
jgi:agmatine deiminase